MCSIYEFMYSFRDKEDDPFPDLLSENALKALETMKRIKDTISSGNIFKNEQKNIIIIIKILKLKYYIYYYY